MKTRRLLILGLGVAVTAVLSSGCGSMSKSSSTTAAATALPPAKALQPGDLASLAGEWEGTLRGKAGTGPLAGQSTPVKVTVAPDGSYTTSIQGRPGAGMARIADGKVNFAGSTTRGTATLHEGGGRRVLRGEGTWVGFDGESSFELTKR
jgi:hypothetical protein